MAVSGEGVWVRRVGGFVLIGCGCAPEPRLEDHRGPLAQVLFSP